VARMKEGVLTQDEARSAVYQKIKRYAEERLAHLRAQNDDNLDPARTAILRGRIKEAKKFAALDKPLPDMEQDVPDLS